MEDITAKAVPQLNENANPNAMDDDWIVNFCDKSRKVFDGEMQALWARVLAGEANAPGTYSKRTVNFLLEMDKDEAELFSKLCKFKWTIDRTVVPLVFNVQEEMYKKHDIGDISMGYLESIGLIQFDKFGFLSGFRLQELPKRVVADYYGKSIHLEMSYDERNELRIGCVYLTIIGQELALLCESGPVDGFFDYVKEIWKEYLPETKKNKKDNIEETYAILDEMVGFCESDKTDGSVNHDGVMWRGFS